MRWFAAFVACSCFAPSALAQGPSEGPARPAAAPAGPVEPVPDAAKRGEGFGLGFAVHRFQDDFGLGALAASPTFLEGMLRVTAGGGVAWYPRAIDDEGFETWKLYGHTRVVLEGGARVPGTQLRLYGFGGPTLLVLPSGLSSKALRFGGVGGFGFEVRLKNLAHGGDAPVSYFAEFGGIGTGATANRLPSHPIFANGFLITAGLRAYF
ncbi:MAG TPA: hypothetical protein VFS43_15140 [Polyangiaceae bacterium]|nr:hypothetical protein [Polyangiaceae bacterium]